MLEILFLIWLCKTLAAVAKRKHRSGAWGGLGAAFYFAGAVLGAGLGAVRGATDASLYALALLGGVVGALLAALIVNLLAARADPYDPATFA